MSNDPNSNSHRNVKRSLCMILPCIAPLVDSLCFQSSQLKYNGASVIRKSNRAPTGYFTSSRSNPLSPSDSCTTACNGFLPQHHRLKSLYISSQLSAAPCKIPESSLSRNARKEANRKIMNSKKSASKSTYETARAYQRGSTMEHDILSREEENELGSKIVAVLQLRDKIPSILDDTGIVVADIGISNQNWEDMELNSMLGSMK